MCRSLTGEKRRFGKLRFDHSHNATLNSLGFVALSPSRGPGLDAQISQWCTSARFKPRIVQHADDILTIHAVVAAGLGAAFLPWHGVEALGNRTNSPYRVRHQSGPLEFAGGARISIRCYCGLSTMFRSIGEEELSQFRKTAPFIFPLPFARG